MALEQIDKIRINGVLKKGIESIKYMYFFPNGDETKYDCKDVLEYLVALAKNKLETKTFSQKSFNKNLYVIALFLTAYNKKYGDIDEVIEFELINIENTINEQIENGIIEEDEETLVNIEKINKYIKKKNRKKDFKRTQYVSQIIELEKQIAELTSQLSKLEKTYTTETKSHNKELEKKRKEIESIKASKTKLDKEIERLKEEKSTKDRNISGLKNDISVLNKQINELNDRISFLEKELETLNNVNKNNIESLEEKDKLFIELQSKYDAIIADQNYQIVKNQIRDIILKVLFKNNNITLDELYNKIKRKNIKIKKIDLFKIIMELRFTYCIDKTIDNHFYLEKNVQKNQTLDLPYTNNSDIDILVISDYYLTEVNNMIIKDLDIIFDYCFNNNISYILYLGNFIKIPYYTKGTSQLLNETETILEQVISKFPYVEGIQNIILGGRKELNALNSGVNPLSYITNNRFDFTSIGFRHGILNIANKSILLHSTNHTNKNNMYELLDDYYQTYSLKRKNTYLDIVGYGDKHIIDLPNSSLLVPSINNNEHFGDCTHIKFTIDDNNNLCNTVIMPLVRTNKLYISSQVLYKK